MRSTSWHFVWAGLLVPAALTAQQVTPPRPIPGPVRPPPAFVRAVEQGTRTTTGRPGPAYWQQWAEYHLGARLLPEARRIEGTATILYHNRSPHPLPLVILYLLQNVNAEGAVRSGRGEVTGGVTLRRVSAGGEALPEIHGREERGAGYAAEGTDLAIRLAAPLAPGDSLLLELEWTYTVPTRGRTGGGDGLFHIAYWYPQMAVYDDVVGWQADTFRGGAEFYAGFGTYDVTVEVPPGWLVTATGTLENPDEVLASAVLERYRRAAASDSVVHVVTEADFGPGRATREAPDGVLRWRFHADSVRDVAFSAMLASNWDAVRAAVGDPDGDGETEYTVVHSFWRPSAPRWARQWRFAQQSIAFLSEWLGRPYPWPQVTSVEGNGVIGGGMEFPMMTFIGGGREVSADADTVLFDITLHELGHMWVPMTVSTDERRYGWLDEGITSFNEAAGMDRFFPGPDHFAADRESYLATARAGLEGEIMRWSDFQYNGRASTNGAYWKPSTVINLLRAHVGEERFGRALRAFIARWAYRHPTPWDFFNTVSDVTGRDLDWFWTAWFYETWTLDRAVAAVTPTRSGTTIVIEDRGWVPMPARVRVGRENGQVVWLEVPVETWLGGATRAEVRVPRGAAVVRVEVDPDPRVPDADRSNNVWERR
jgi:hypothetical protein